MEDRLNRNNLIVGVILVVAGLFFGLTRFYQLPGWEQYWPLGIALAGVLLFIGMFLGGRKTAGLAIPASLLVALGLILFVQSWFQVYETWVYAWALIVCALGFGIAIAGLWGQQPEQRRGGWRLMRFGALLFLVLGAFFELLFSHNGIHRTANYFWAVALILVGLGMFVMQSIRLISAREQVNPIDRNLFFPVLIAGSGLVWLLVDLGRLSYANVAALSVFWPALLIAVGLDLLIGRRYPPLGALIGVALVAGTIWLAHNPPDLPIKGWQPFNTPQMESAQERLTGSGEQVSQVVVISGYEAIDLSASGVAKLIQDGEPGVEVRGDANLLPYLTFGVRNKTLEIGVKPGYSLAPTQPFRYQIHVKELGALRATGASEISMTGLSGDKLSLSISGSGKIALNQVRVNRLEAVTHGMSVLEFSGEAAELDLDLNGASTVTAPELQVARARIRLAGLGNLTLWVTKTLEVGGPGPGQVSYYGSPQIKQERKTGVGLNMMGGK